MGNTWKQIDERMRKEAESGKSRFSDLEIKELRRMQRDITLFLEDCENKAKARKKKMRKRRNAGEKCPIDIVSFLKSRYNKRQLALFRSFESYAVQSYPRSPNGSMQLDIYKQKLLWPPEWINWRHGGVYERHVGARDNVSPYRIDYDNFEKE